MVYTIYVKLKLLKKLKFKQIKIPFFKIIDQTDTATNYKAKYI
mgnify:CR=1